MGTGKQYDEEFKRSERIMDMFERKDRHCPCCGKFEYEEVNGYEVCEVCGWEDDPLQFEKPDYAGGANGISLNEYRQKWQAGEVRFQLSDDS